jgi:toluene monooxygenase system protein D
MKRESDHIVGPVLSCGDIADACTAAIYEDNPDTNIVMEDHGSYIRLQAESDCILRRDTIERHLGRPFQMQEIEFVLCSFAGRIDTTTESIRFFTNSSSNKDQKLSQILNPV